MADLSTFWESIGANALLAAAYMGWKLFERCQRSKCKMDKEHGLTFDLGDPSECAATDMGKLGELLKARSMHHLKSRSPPTHPPPTSLV
jgi:hypothetical protein